MRKIILILIVIIPSINFSYGQGVFVHNANILNSLKTGELNVVIPDNEFGKVLKEAVTNHWTETKYKFITEKELASYEDKKKINLLGNFSGKFMAHRYELSNIPFLGITNSYSLKSKYFYKKKNLLAHIMFSLDGVSNDKLKSVVTLHVKTLNYLVKTGGYKTWSPSMNKLKAKVKKQTVIICKDDMKGSIAELEEKYTGKVKVVEKEAYDKALSGEEEVLMLVFIKDEGMYSFLSVVSNKGVVYYSDLNHSAAKKDWDKEFLIRFFKNLN